MILPDTEIRHLCEQYDMVVGWDADLLNPASLDVRLGPDLLIETHDTPEMRPHSIRYTTPEHPYLLSPREFVLAHTIEIFNIPDDVCARFMLKSSRAREGRTLACRLRRPRLPQLLNDPGTYERPAPSPDPPVERNARRPNGLRANGRPTLPHLRHKRQVQRM